MLIQCQECKVVVWMGGLASKEAHAGMKHRRVRLRCPVKEGCRFRVKDYCNKAMMTLDTRLEVSMLVLVSIGS